LEGCYVRLQEQPFTVKLLIHKATHIILKTAVKPCIIYNQQTGWQTIRVGSQNPLFAVCRSCLYNACTIGAFVLSPRVM